MRTGLIYIILAVIFIIIFALSKKRNLLETNEFPLFQEHCGGIFNFCKLTFPFVRHALYKNFIVISYLTNTYAIQYEELLYVEIKGHFFSNYVRYYHNRKDIPSPIIIFSHSLSEIKEIIKKHEVTIKEF